MPDIAGFLDDPGRPEYQHVIRPLTRRERERLQRECESNRYRASQTKQLPRNLLIRSSLATWFLLVGFLLITTPLWYGLPLWVSESFIRGRPAPDWVERWMLLGPMLLAFPAAIVYQRLRPAIAQNQCRRLNKRLGQALELSLIHEITVRCERCITDFRIEDDDLYYSDRIVYELPSGRVVIAGQVSFTNEEEVDELAREVCCFRYITGYDLLWEAIGVGASIPIEFQVSLPRRYAKSASLHSIGRLRSFPSCGRKHHIMLVKEQAGFPIRTF